MTMFAIIIITAVEFFKASRIWLRLGVLVIGVLAIVNSFLAHSESQEQALEIQSLRITNDSLMEMARLQLSGELEAILGQSQLTASGVYMRSDKFRSKWTQDLQDVVIYMRFDSHYQRVVIRQKTSGGILNVTCPTIDTTLEKDNLRYPCVFLAKGNWIEVQTYSKKPLNVIDTILTPNPE